MDLNGLIELLRTTERVGVLNARREDIVTLIPEVRKMFEYDQRNKAHQYDLWYHTLHTVVGLPRNLDDGMLYLAALLHDIGKPYVCMVDSTGQAHYYGHQRMSRDIVLKMGLDINYVDGYRLIYYIRHHDDEISLTSGVLKDLTVGELKNLLLLEIADAKAHILVPEVVKRIAVCKDMYDRLDSLE